MSPVYPAENTNAVLREKQMARCRRFEEKKRRLYSAMSCVIGDTLVPVTDFFRFGLHYYAISEEIPEPRLTGESSVETLSREEKPGNTAQPGFVPAKGCTCRASSMRI